MNNVEESQDVSYPDDGQSGEMEENAAEQMDEENQFDEEDNNATKKRSKLWRHFTILRDESGIRFAKCNHCSK